MVHPTKIRGTWPNSITVVGEHLDRPKSEFAKVELTGHPAEVFDVVDSVPEKADLEKLGAGSPDSVILCLLDILMDAEQGPLRDFRVVLERVDSTRNAFRGAGRDAGRKILEAIHQYGGFESAETPVDDKRRNIKGRPFGVGVDSGSLRSDSRQGSKPAARRSARTSLRIQAMERSRGGLLSR